MSDRFVLVVVGTGSAAVSVAYPCREAGWSLAMVDDRPFGGTCTTRGCDPRRVLVGAAACGSELTPVSSYDFASTVFALPPLASFGLTEKAALKQGLEIDVHHQDTSGSYNASRIAGAHILGAGAEEQINHFALVIRHGFTAEQIKEQLYAFPSQGSDPQYML